MFNLDDILSAARPQPVLIDKSQALPGRQEALELDYEHAVLKTSFQLPPEKEGLTYCLLGMGCFWGAERAFWEKDEVYSTAVGYAGGYTPNPTYEEVCSGQTGHTEVVLVIFDKEVYPFARLIADFLELHNPTQGMRQGNDRGTQYRSGLYLIDPKTSSEFATVAKRLFEEYDHQLGEQDLTLTSEIQLSPSFYYAESYHQQYLAKHPGGYCNIQTIQKTGLPALNKN